MDKGKVEKVEESGEVTKGALIVTERGGGEEVALCQGLRTDEVRKGFDWRNIRA